MTRKRRKKKLSIFIPAIFLFAVFAIIFSLLFRDKMDEGIMALVMFAVLPFVIIAWIVDGFAQGVIFRGRWLSLRDATSTVKEVTRKDNPLSFWTMVALSFIFALAILVFVVLGIYTRLTLVS